MQQGKICHSTSPCSYSTHESIKHTLYGGLTRGAVVKILRKYKLYLDRNNLVNDPAHPDDYIGKWMVADGGNLLIFRVRNKK